ncbi:hypothetical protein BGZ63DRAFT_420825 [Mariannaea sp. PMI_226]|nr:hypothetical protein BGZ63DRAFT_420825 [Mariannaea sp. PMI_226]
MGPDSDEVVVTPLSYPGWVRARLERGLQSDIECNGYGSGDDHSDFNNQSFLETATLSSFSGSFSRYPHPQYEVGADRMRTIRAHAQPIATSLANVYTRSEEHRPATAFASSPSNVQYLADESFFLSRQTSVTTMARTTSSEGGAFLATDSSNPPSFRSSNFWRQQPRVQLQPTSEPTAGDDNNDDQNSVDRPHPLRFLDSLDHELLFPDSQHFASQSRPSSSRSHLQYWRRNRSPRVSSDEPDSSRSFDGNRPSIIITRDEYEALPPTIQRKYFSTIERSQVALQLDSGYYQVHLESLGHSPSGPAEDRIDKPVKRRQHRKTKTASDPSTISSGRTRINSIDRLFFANLPEKIKRQHLTEEEQIAAQYRRQTLVSSPSTYEQVLTIEKRQTKDRKMQSPISSPTLSEGHSSLSSGPPREVEKKRVDSFYDSFRWLEEDESLDLRLYLDDYHINLREEIPVPNKHRRPSFRRHLSINKLPFGRGSISYSRPPVRDMPSSPSLSSACQSPILGPQGHVRNRSRAVSLMSSRPLSPEYGIGMDAEATHYQDPEARKKLRDLFTSPQKFDEAIEFGFPSPNGMKPNVSEAEQGGPGATKSEKFGSFLEDERSSSGEEVSVEDPESPKTPHLFPPVQQPSQTTTESSHKRKISLRNDLKDPLASREMTLRMTLTRPDLRANEEQMYGWKQAGGSRGALSREETASPLIYARDENRKESIERQLAAFDQFEDPVLENGVVKRLWNRVRRA